MANRNLVEGDAVHVDVDVSNGAGTGFARSVANMGPSGNAQDYGSGGGLLLDPTAATVLAAAFAAAAATTGGVDAVNAIGSAPGATPTLKYGDNTLTLSANITGFVFPTAIAGAKVKVQIIQHTGTHYTVSWTGARGASQPTMTATDAAVNEYFLECFDGTHWDMTNFKQALAALT